MAWRYSVNDECTAFVGSDRSGSVSGLRNFMVLNTMYDRKRESSCIGMELSLVSSVMKSQIEGCSLKKESNSFIIRSSVYPLTSTCLIHNVARIGGRRKLKTDQLFYDGLVPE